MANIAVSDLYPIERQRFLDEKITVEEMKNIFGGTTTTFTINLGERDMQILRFYEALNDPNRGPITISFPRY